jgi:hypothetical protein
MGYPYNGVLVQWGTGTMQYQCSGASVQSGIGTIDACSQPRHKYISSSKLTKYNTGKKYDDPKYDVFLGPPY